MLSTLGSLAVLLLPLGCIVVAVPNDVSELCQKFQRGQEPIIAMGELSDDFLVVSTNFRGFLVPDTLFAFIGAPSLNLTGVKTTYTVASATSWPSSLPRPTTGKGAVVSWRQCDTQKEGRGCCCPLPTDIGIYRPEAKTLILVPLDSKQQVIIQKLKVTSAWPRAIFSRYNFMTAVMDDNTMKTIYCKSDSTTWTCETSDQSRNTTDEHIHQRVTFSTPPSKNIDGGFQRNSPSKLYEESMFLGNLYAFSNVDRMVYAYKGRLTGHQSGQLVLAHAVPYSAFFICPGDGSRRQQKGPELGSCLAKGQQQEVCSAPTK